MIVAFVAIQFIRFPRREIVTAPVTRNDPFNPVPDIWLETGVLNGGVPAIEVVLRGRVTKPAALIHIALPRRSIDDLGDAPNLVSDCLLRRFVT
jgi:hypothetical protein